MQLKKLISNLPQKQVLGDDLIDIKDIKINSNLVTKGTIFVCLNGRDFDGHAFIGQAENYGAEAVICERRLDTKITQIIVPDTRIALSIISSEFYGHPERKLKIIGVTGTNGKTTTTHLIKSILDYAQLNCGVMGTLGTFYNNKFLEPTLTTPDPLEFYKILRDMVDCGVNILVMEVSAHSLFLDKLYGIEFEIVCFTNFTQDHLDFFVSMENYKKAKLKLFDNFKYKYIVSNGDDELGRYIINNYNSVISYGIENPADNFAIDVKLSNKNTSFIINLFDRVYELDFALIGGHNVYNALCASTAVALLGVKIDDIIGGLKSAKVISGRLENIYGKKFDIFIDYAHTPDGLYKTLSTLKSLEKNRLICVFGCGGNRDKGKRKIMGKISGELADFTVITSDNPRYEEPMEIIREIEEGVLTKSKNYVIVQDRFEGIKYAIDMATEKDIILIAGKGAEKYQEVLGIKRIFNDKDTVKEILGSKF